MMDSVELSLSELRDVITKAARGAGMAWGLAEEAGWAADWLARRGLPAADWATAWLANRIDGGVSPVEVGVAMADDVAGFMSDGGALPDGLAGAGYLLPFLHRMAKGNGPLVITSERGLVALVTPEGQVQFGPFWQPQSTGWTITKASEGIAALGDVARPMVSNSALECLYGMALRTTVPPSDLSRRDAGSLAGDND